MPTSSDMRIAEREVRTMLYNAGEITSSTRSALPPIMTPLFHTPSLAARAASSSSGRSAAHSGGSADSSRGRAFGLPEFLRKAVLESDSTLLACVEFCFHLWDVRGERDAERFHSLLRLSGVSPDTPKSHKPRISRASLGSRFETCNTLTLVCVGFVRCRWNETAP